MAPYFSVIIPVYNVEDCLEKCVASVLEQSFSDYEIILVDDGSTDRSGKIADEFGDFRIHVIHQENRGASGARNTGMAISSGKYIVFMDSDDYWNDANFLKNVNIILEHEKTEVLLFGIKTINSQTGSINSEKRYEKLEKRTMSSLELTAANLYNTSPCNKIMLREFLFKNKLFFDEGIVAEDIDWTFRILSVLDSDIAVYKEDVYVYNINRTGTVSFTIGEKHIRSLAYIMHKDYKILGNISKNRQVCINYLSYQYLSYIGHIGMVYNLEKEEKLCKEVLQYWSLVDNSQIPLVKYVSSLAKVIGKKRVMKLLNFYTAIKR